MSSLDDILENKENKSQKSNDSWKTKKQNTRNEVFKIANDTAVQTVFDEKTFVKYLDTQSKFDMYSATNALLIMAQNPNATQLKDFESWKKAGLQVQKDEKGVKILEPSGEYKDKEGNVRQGFNVKSLFDISQTDSDKETDFKAQPDSKELLKALIYRRPVQISMTNQLEHGRGAYYDHEKQLIFVVRGQSDPELFRSVSYELAHAEFAQDDKDYTRKKYDFPSYCVSYMLCKKNGIDTSNYNFGNIPESYRAVEPAQIRAKLSEIRDVMSNITERMNRILSPEKVPKQKEQER